MKIHQLFKTILVLTINHTNFISSTSGANALQVNNEDIKETENDLLTSMVDENMALNNSSAIESNNDDSIYKDAPLKLDENSEVNQNALSKKLRMDLKTLI